jgi:glycine C-acetyltransferase
MPTDRLSAALTAELADMREKGTLKGSESVITDVIRAGSGRGPRYRLAGEGEREFIKMNSNNYLGMALRPEVIAAEEEAARRFGAGPGAVRFISGTYAPHLALEERLARFHGREAAMIFSSAYAAVLGVLTSILTPDTVIISDELNHNCIINAARLSRAGDRQVYRHLDLGDLAAKLAAAAGQRKRAVVVTDGIFSMRGDHGPLREISALVRESDARFEENAVLVVDDSHGVGAFGRSGRGTEEYTEAPPCDFLVATLGKALGVNGGYVVTSRLAVDYLRQKAAMYIYSNPITPAEAAASLAALSILDSAEGVRLLDHLRGMTRRFREGLVRLGLETLPGEHPVVPLMVRDTARTAALVRHLRADGILATGLTYPVVPKGSEEIRFQISADHTATDIDVTLGSLKSFRTAA